MGYVKRGIINIDLTQLDSGESFILKDIASVRRKDSITDGVFIINTSTIEEEFKIGTIYNISVKERIVDCTINEYGDRLEYIGTYTLVAYEENISNGDINDEQVCRYTFAKTSEDEIMKSTKKNNVLIKK